MTISTFILAIALVETGNNPKAVGKAGELSEYQITRQVWKAHTAKPFTKANARKPIISKYVAFQHAELLESNIPIQILLKCRERDVVILCAAGWHRGEAHMRRPWRSWSAETKDYTMRVWSTYEDLKRKESHGK